MREGRARARRVLRRTGRDWRVVRMGRGKKVMGKKVMGRGTRTRTRRRWRIREGDSSLLYGVGYWVGLGV